jgi:hypothetical protein
LSLKTLRFGRTFLVREKENKNERGYEKGRGFFKSSTEREPERSKTQESKSFTSTLKWVRTPTKQCFLSGMKPLKRS